MRYENYQFFYRCRQLKNSTLRMLFDNCIYKKVSENSEATKIKHLSDIEKALNMENIVFNLGILFRFQQLIFVFKHF